MADTDTSEAVKLTEAAQQAARKYLAEDENPEDKALRLGVTSGGCSGFSYAVSIDVKKANDTVQAYEGFEVVIDSVSDSFLRGATVDYVDTLDQAGFKFSNPQASSSCGCGGSFDVS